MASAERAKLLHEIWMRATEAKIGVKVRTNSYDTLRQELYQIRKRADPMIQAKWREFSLTPCPSNPRGELWIIRRKITIEVPDEEIDDAP